LDDSSFDEPLKTVTPVITKRNTNMQEAIVPSQHLSIMLCYLASANTFEYLKCEGATSQYIGITADKMVSIYFQGYSVKSAKFDY